MQIDGETMETVTDFLLSSKITTDVECNLKIRRHLLPGEKATTNLGNILKSKDITFLANIHMVKAMLFPVVMYGCDGWTIKKTECKRTDAAKMWCWRRLLRVTWTARRSNKSILKEINPE